MTLGRPKVYLKEINQLKDEELYSPTTIARLFFEKPEEIRRMAVTLSRVAKKMGAEGEGTIHLHRRGLVPAWYGSTWKETYLKD